MSPGFITVVVNQIRIVLALPVLIVPPVLSLRATESSRGFESCSIIVGYHRIPVGAIEPHILVPVYKEIKFVTRVNVYSDIVLSSVSAVFGMRPTLFGPNLVVVLQNPQIDPSTVPRSCLR